MAEIDLIMKGGDLNIPSKDAVYFDLEGLSY